LLVPLINYMNNTIKYLFGAIIVLVIVYFMGPHPKPPKINTDPILPIGPLNQLDNIIAEKESQFPLKPDNQARIVWADSTQQMTEYAIVYLHGFSASQMEGNPVHSDIAKKFGCNLYLSRLSDHGIDTSEALLQLTGDRLWESAKKALSVGKSLGNKVILMSTSTGGTLALMLAAYYPKDVYALVNMSPNIAIKAPTSRLLNDPWGLQISRLVMGSIYNHIDYDSSGSVYWNNKYRLEALTELEELVESQMHPRLFKKVNQPCLNLYYYKDETHQDDVVDVQAILKMHDALASKKKVAVPIPSAGNHVIGGSILSQDIQAVEDQIEKFMIDVLKINPKQQNNISLK